ncbi:MAG: hypothetical protein U0168_12955 [Nannocystaceae bacterium]
MRKPFAPVPRLLVLAAVALAAACGSKVESTDASVGDEGSGSSTSGGSNNDSNSGNDGNDSASASMSSSAGSMTGTSMSTTASETDPDTGMGFIGMPDDGSIEAMCDPGMQDCPRGQKCTGYVSTPGGRTVDANHCVDVTGDHVFGEECERVDGNDDCAPGFFCMTDVSGHTGMGICLEYCVPNEPCDNGGMCFPFNDGSLPLCEVTCDPLLQDCVPGQGCYAAFDNFVCAIPGAPEGMGNDGDPCATIQGCQPGLICRTGTNGCAADTGCCTPVCDLTDDQCTDPTEDCIQALDDPPPMLQNVGYCGVPA